MLVGSRAGLEQPSRVTLVAVREATSDWEGQQPWGGDSQQAAAAGQVQPSNERLTHPHVNLAVL